MTPGGVDGGGGAGANGGAGGAGGTGAGPCGPLGIKSAVEFETKFLPVKCAGDDGCHRAVFFPRYLNDPTKARAAVLNVKAGLLCRDSYYVDKADVTKSFLLAKVSATGERVDCPNPDPKDGGFRMPLKKGTTNMPDTPLTADELACFTWWVETIAK